MSKQKPPESELQTIDPTALATVSGGASFGPTEMMMFMMMMMGGGNSAPAQVAAPPGTIGGYAGYTIDGVYYPFK
jgi:hypothetical protein